MLVQKHKCFDESGFVLSVGEDSMPSPEHYGLVIRVRDLSPSEDIYVSTHDRPSAAWCHRIGFSFEWVVLAHPGAPLIVYLAAVSTFLI